MRAKTFDYRVALSRDGAVSADGAGPVRLDEEWLPEHLLLAALAQCTLASLRFYARDTAVEATASAEGTVTRRDDGLYGLVEVEVVFDVELDPEPADLDALLARAEGGCFVGNSLTAKPAYRWRVNGREAG